MTRKRVKVENKKIGERIKHLRKTFDTSYIVEGGDGMGLTQQELADKLWVSEETVKSWEQCYSYPSADLLIRLSDFFRCSVDYILGLTDRKTPKARLSDDALMMLERFPNGMVQIISDFLSDEKLMYDLRIAVATNHTRAGIMFSAPDIFAEDDVSIDVYGEDINRMVSMRLYVSIIKFLQNERKRLEPGYNPMDPISL